MASVAIIGAGVVGAAVGHALAERGHEVYVLDRNARVGEGVTSRNSGVIHAGLYYPPGSLKARSCIRGNALLYEWCQKNDVPHLRTGKWIVAQGDEEESLEAMIQNASASGCKSLVRASANSLAKLKSQGVQADAAVFSPDTGIVDAYSYTRSFELAAVRRGAEFLLHAEVSRIERSSNGWSLSSARGEIEVDAVVNCAGLYSDTISEMAGVKRYPIYPWRGDYFRVSGISPSLPALVYPVKKKGAAGLGVHLTRDLSGQYRLGPDVALAASKEDFSDPLQDLSQKKRRFLEAAQRYLPMLGLDQLEYDTCGIRPKLRSPEDREDPDFIVSLDAPGFVQLAGIESPGLTAAIDLAQRAADLLS